MKAVRTKQCLHENVQRSVCSDCGKNFHMLDTYEGSGSSEMVLIPTKGSRKTIMNDLKRLKLPKDVMDTAEIIYQKINPSTTKKSRRAELVFYCIFCAYQELDVVVDPVFIARDLGITRESIPKAMNTYSTYPGYKPKSRDYKPTALIPEYAQRLNLANVDEIVALGEQICSQSDKFKEEYPQKVSAGVIFFYMKLNGAVVDRKLFAEKLNTTEATLKSTFNSIWEVYNK